MNIRNLFVSAVLLASLALPHSLAAAPDPAWMRPFPPFHIAGNLYYVGSEDLASYLIVTPQGLILINSSFDDSVPLIQKSVETLGFHFRDIKILLISHAHGDHDAGSARVLRMTGAKYEVMEGDVSVVESGGATDFNYGSQANQHYPRAHVDRILHDGSTVRLGGTVLTAHLTAGHTKGTTTWTVDEKENGKTLHAVIIGSPNVNPGYKLVNNKAYPRIAEDYKHMFEVLNSLPCDLFLGAHGLYFGLTDKYPRWKAGDKDAFVDPAGYKAYVAERKQTFEAELDRQQAAKP